MDSIEILKWRILRQSALPSSKRSYQLADSKLLSKSGLWMSGSSSNFSLFLLNYLFMSKYKIFRRALAHSTYWHRENWPCQGLASCLLPHFLRFLSNVRSLPMYVVVECKEQLANTLSGKVNTFRFLQIINFE